MRFNKVFGVVRLWPGFLAVLVFALSPAWSVFANTVTAEAQQAENLDVEEEKAEELDLPVEEVDKKEPEEIGWEEMEQRLRDTPAIGFFTKLALRNEIQDLVQQFDAYHRNETDKDLEQLQERYNLLLLRIVVLLQDDDPELARDILASRQAIWSILADPERFATIQV